MKDKEAETWRHRYIRLLSDASSRTDAQEDLQAMEDLIDEGLLRGAALHNGDGVVDSIVALQNPTLKGRLFLEDQTAYLRSRTFAGRLKASWPLFSGFIIAFMGWGLGLLTPLIQQRLQARINIQNQQQTNATGADDLTPRATHQPKPLAPAVAPIPSNPGKP